MSDTATPLTPEQFAAALGKLLDGVLDGMKYVYFAANEYGQVMTNTVSNSAKTARAKACELHGCTPENLDKAPLSIRRIERAEIKLPFEKSEYISGMRLSGYDREEVKPS